MQLAHSQHFSFTARELPIGNAVKTPNDAECR
jgi:hypothetical protein